MNITGADAKMAGKTRNNVSFTDDELINLIKVTKITLTFLESKGGCELMTTPLRQELEQLDGFANSRGLNRTMEKDD